MENVKPSIPRRAIRFHVALQIAAAVILLLAANYFSFNHYGRWDFSRSQKYVLSEQTKRVIRDLDRPVRVTVFFSPTTASPETRLYPDVGNLLKEFIFSGRQRKRFEVEYVDPTRDLTRARELQAKYKFSASENVLILDYEGRTKFIPVSDMADFDVTPMMSGDPPRLLAFKGEQAITNGLIALTNPERLKMYFLQGHGEPGVGEGTPLAIFKDYAERQNVGVAPLALSSLDAMPGDCTVLAIVAPQFDLSERETALLEKYWKDKGSILVLLDPLASTPNLRAFLGRAGISPQNNRVVRLWRLPQGTGILIDVTAEFLPESTVTKRLVGASLVLPGATQSLAIDVKKSQAGGVQVWPLLRAAEDFWGETNYDSTKAETQGVRYDEGVDAGYPVYVGAAAARGGVSDERVQVESSKLVVVGSSQFALDAALSRQGQGLDFLLSSVNWLVDRGQLTGVMPKTVRNFSLSLTEGQMASITFYTMFVMPGAAALLGLIAWWRRRS